MHDDITNPLGAISNISEWCKKEACWDRLQSNVTELRKLLPKQFLEELVSKEDVTDAARFAAKTQKIHSGIEAQQAVLDISPHKWSQILAKGQEKKLYSPKEVGILQVAAQMPLKIPSERQAIVLLQILEKARVEAIYQD